MARKAKPKKVYRLEIVGVYNTRGFKKVTTKTVHTNNVEVIDTSYHKVIYPFHHVWEKLNSKQLNNHIKLFKSCDKYEKLIVTIDSKIELVK